MIKQNDSFMGKIGQCLKQVCDFLSVQDKLRLANTNSVIRSMVLSGRVWGLFQINDRANSSQWTGQLEWIRKYMFIVKPSSINIMVFDNAQDENLLKIFLNQMPFVKNIKVYCQSIGLHLLIAQSCSEAEALALGSSIVSDRILEQMCNRMSGMSGIRQLTILKDDMEFVCKNISSYLSKQLRKLILKPHTLEFEELFNFVKEASFLQELEFDVEECPQSVFINIVERLQRIEKLRVYHVENMTDDQSFAKVMTPNVRQLILTKAHHLSMDRIISKVSSKNLTLLDLTEALLLTDDLLVTISDKSPNLKHLNISWCTNVKNEGVRAVIKKCQGLQSLVLTGLKSLNDKAFQEYQPLLEAFLSQKYQNVASGLRSINKATQGKDELQHLSDCSSQFLTNYSQQMYCSVQSFKSLKLLDCISCNQISDNVLRVIYCFHRQAKILNYYSNNMGLYSDSDFDDYC